MEWMTLSGPQLKAFVLGFITAAAGTWAFAQKTIGKGAMLRIRQLETRLANSQKAAESKLERLEKEYRERIDALTRRVDELQESRVRLAMQAGSHAED